MVQINADHLQPLKMITLLCAIFALSWTKTHNGQQNTQPKFPICLTQHAKMTTLKSNLFPTLYNPYIQNFAMCNI